MQRPLIMQKIIFLVLLLYANNCLADDRDTAINKVSQLSLYNNKTWLKLLHIPKNKDKSQILSKKFFTSKNANKDPKVEIYTLINAYFEEIPSDINSYLVCKFPARYYWLDSHIKLPNFSNNIKLCNSLNIWQQIADTKSISLLHVSGYFGNPASSFGHSLLKLNSDGDSNLDHTLNFGAIVPNNENIISYILKGIFGAYRAVFSDQQYYTRDLVYARHEDRDIWEYELNLTQFQLNLITYHALELMNMEFQYFFFSKNCAYRLGELINVAIDDTLVKTNRPWYSPLDLFQMIEKLNDDRIINNDSPFIKKIIFIPSPKRVFANKLKQTSLLEKSVIKAIIARNDNTRTFDISELDNLDTEAKIKSLNTIITYNNYKLKNAKKSSEKKNLRKFKDSLLLERLKITEAQNTTDFSKDLWLRPPARGNPPTNLGFKAIQNKEGNNIYQINWSPYKRYNLGINSLEKNEYIIFDFYFETNPTQNNKINLTHLNLIKISKIQQDTFSKINNDRNNAWKINLGVTKEMENADHSYNIFGDIALGKTLLSSKNKTLLIFADASINSTQPNIRFFPHLQYHYTYKKFAFNSVYGFAYKSKFNEKFTVKAQYNHSKTLAFNLNINNNYNSITQLQLGASWYY